MSHTRTLASPLAVPACAFVLAISGLDAATMAETQIPTHEADEVPTFVDLGIGESFRFRLRNGEARLVQLTDCRLVERSTYDYGLEADLFIDGHPLKLTRWFASTKAFGPPTVVNGMRLALEIARAGDEHFSDKRNPTERIAHWYRLEKNARLLVNDMTLPLWPGVRPMWGDADIKITADQIGYRTHTFFGRRDHDTGDMGRAMGRLHNDLDIAFPVGTPHFAPFDGTVTQISPFAAMFVSNELGEARKRYWMIMGHVSEILKEPDAPFVGGERIALSGDKLAGSIPHTHLALVELGEGDSALGEPRAGPYMNGPHLDPWWLIWQGFENERSRRTLTRAVMGPLSPAQIGHEIAFSSEGSVAAANGGLLAYGWDFGDGASSSDPNPTHRYGGSGIYRVCLTARDGKGHHAVSQHLTVDGLDRSPPQVREVIYPAQDDGESREFLVVFSERVRGGSDATGAENPGNYRVEDGPAIESVEMLPGRSRVRLSVGPGLRVGKDYRLHVSSVTDLAGNAIRPAASARLHVTKRVVLHPVADAEAFDHNDHADKNFGSLSTISLRAGRGRFGPWPNFGNNKFGYLRFEVPARNVTAASLRLFISGRSPNAFLVLPLAEDEWSETGLTFRTAPDLYRPVPLGVIEGRPDGWHEVDVTEYVHRHLEADRSAGLCFGLRAVANDAPIIQVDTREGSNPPRLVIQCDQ